MPRRYVIHEHHARRLHWDLRLEVRRGELGAKRAALKSWALPKEPPRSAGTKRLAIATEDHALSYASFEGVIEEGYGKGVVKMWDSGSYTPIKLKPKEIIVELHGKKLKGTYVLIKTKFAKNSWLFFRKKAGKG